MSIKSQAISGVRWTSISSGTIALVQLLKISVLTRFLDKSDFGLIAMALFVINFLNLFMDMGLSSAILHKREITKNEYSSLYWINLCFSLILFALICLIAPLVSSFYAEEELTMLLPIMAISLILSAFGRQFKTIAQKNLKFKRIALVESLAAIVSLIFSIFLAVYNFGVYALVLAVLLQHTLSNVYFFIYGIKKDSICLRYSYSDTKPFLKIGMYQVGGQVVNYFNRDIDILLVGKLFGSEILGGYNLAKQLVFRPVQVLNPILTRVSPAILVKFQDNIEDLRRNYLRLVNAVATINIPVYILIVIFASPIVKIIYGGSFESIATIVQILSIYMIIRSIGNPVGSLVIATGRTDLEFYWNLIVLLIMPLAIWAGTSYGIVGVSWSILIFRLILFIPSWYFLIWKMIKVPLLDYVRAIVPSFRTNFRAFLGK